MTRTGEPHLNLVDIVDGVVELHRLPGLWLLGLRLVTGGGGSHRLGPAPSPPVGGLVVGVMGGPVSGGRGHVGRGWGCLWLHGKHVHLLTRHGLH